MSFHFSTFFNQLTSDHTEKKLYSVFFALIPTGQNKDFLYSGDSLYSHLKADICSIYSLYLEQCCTLSSQNNTSPSSLCAYVHIKLLIWINYSPHFLMQINSHVGDLQ